jgi:hypothetical protein
MAVKHLCMCVDVCVCDRLEVSRAEVHPATILCDARNGDVCISTLAATRRREHLMIIAQ